MQNVVLSGKMAYVEDGHLVIVIPIPTEGIGWVPDKSASVERVTAIHAANGKLGFRDMLEAGSQVGIEGLDDPTAKVIVKLTVDPFVARDVLGQTIVVPDRQERGTRKERKGIPLDELTRKAVDNSRRPGPVTTRKLTPRERATADINRK